MQSKPLFSFAGHKGGTPDFLWEGYVKSGGPKLDFIYPFEPAWGEGEVGGPGI